jgi:hypothetical protein
MSAAAVLSLAAAVPKLDSTVRILAVVMTAVMVGVVLELVRRRLLSERYALLWMVVALLLLVLAVWTELLSWLTDLVGIQVPANFLFLAAFGVGFLLLLHFSVANTRLSEETKILAQEVARLDAKLEARDGNGKVSNGGAGSAPEDARHEPPVAPQADAD